MEGHYVQTYGERRFSYDLDQGGIELPADFRFTSSNPKLLEQTQTKRPLQLKHMRHFGQEREGKKKDNKTKK